MSNRNTAQIPSLHAANSAALWAGIRLVVIDTETTRTPGGGPLRAVAVARVTCRAGTIRSTWNTLVNPGVPIDSFSQSKHHITDDHVEGEPDFSAIAPMLLPSFDPVAGERVIVVAHNVGFDISVLRHELDNAALVMPDLPTLDTMRLAPLVGATGPRPSLELLCETLGIVNARPHDAHADAVACAEAAIGLLDLAAKRGHSDFDQLLDAAGRGASTLTVKASKRGGTPADTKPVTPALPAEHTAGHTKVLSRRAGTRMLAEWRQDLTDCGRLRCPHVVGRATAAKPPTDVVLREAHIVLADLVADGDVAGAATVLSAVLELLGEPAPGSRNIKYRNSALRWDKHWSPLLTPLGRCDEDDMCPDCRTGATCPLDAWPDRIASLALGDPNNYAHGYFEMNGVEAGTGAYTTWLEKGTDQRVADSALQIAATHWRTVGQQKRATKVVQLAWDAGCRHPDVVDAHAAAIAAAGRTSDYRKALALCDQTLALAGESTHESWRRLRSRRAQIAGRARRLDQKNATTHDEDGNLIPVRRHHPDKPHRTRTPRFARN